MKKSSNRKKGSKKTSVTEKKQPVQIESHFSFMHVGKALFWFCMGAFLALFFLISFIFILFQRIHQDKVYPGVIVYGVDFGGKTQEQVKGYFIKRNARIKDSTFTFSTDNEVATVSAQQLRLGYDSTLMAQQAYSIGRSPYLLSNFLLVFQAYVSGVRLPPAYYYNGDLLTTALTPLIQKVYKPPVDAVFKVQNKRVTEFRPSDNGQTIDIEAVKQKVFSYVPFLVAEARPKEILIKAPVKVLTPRVTTGSAGTYGIKEKIGSGTSFFYHSIPERIHNVTLAASRINGVMIAPDEEFSFDKALGDVSQFTGYKQAYVIQNGKTVLGDGGGVCQISTTFFRAILNTGLPVTERNAHAYRVGYYEGGGFPPGIDATIYVPSVDLKFKNDTGHWMFAQSTVNQDTMQVTIDLYGVKDGRVAVISKPVITSEIPAPPALYQDDPTLPVGVVKQVDFPANGASVVFTYKVMKNNKILHEDTFRSDYRPWQAIYLRGTKV